MNNQADIIDLNGNKTLTSSLSRTMYFFIKRLFDVLMAIIGIIAMIPIALIVKISYMLTGDFDSIFYKQKRIGKNGKIIYIFKYRTMIPDADKVLKELLKKPKYKKEWKSHHKLSNDPRITKVGRILRKSSLDEFPQFINVLKGDLSIIGPRPLVEGELDEHNGNHEIYESVKPGITGWWAANGRSAIDYENRLKLEYYYAKNCNIILDIKCVLLTILIVLQRTGAK